MNKSFVTAGTIAGALVLSVSVASMAFSNSARNAILQGYAAQAGVSSFSAADGQALFSANHNTGKPDTPSCTTCHTNNPNNAGVTRVGKPILPLAISSNAERITDPAKVEKWFRRNCTSVLGRECTPLEKGNFITFLMSQ